MKRDAKFKALYCSLLYRNKKLKSWQDGWMSYDPASKKATLYDENVVKVDTRYFRAGHAIEPHTQLELDANVVLLEDSVENFSSVPSAVSVAPVPLPAPVQKRPRNMQPLKLKMIQKPLESDPEIRNVEVPAKRTSNEVAQIRPKKHNVQAAPVKTCLSAWASDENASGDDAIDSTPILSRHDHRLVSEPISDLPKPQKNKKKSVMSHQPIPTARALLSKEFVEDSSDADRESPAKPYDKSSKHSQKSTLNQSRAPLVVVKPSSSVPKFTDLRFPSAFDYSKSGYLQSKRMAHIPTQFENCAAYSESFTNAVLESVQVQISGYAAGFYQKLKYIGAKYKRLSDLEQQMRMKGFGFYVGSHLSSLSSSASYNKDSSNKNKMYSLEIHNKEHHSKYSKDDIWVISTSKDFQVSFLAKSTFFGPMSSGNIEMVALSLEDSKKADTFLKRGEPIAVFALKVLNASSDFSMITNLSESMEQLSILPSILGGTQPPNSLASLVQQDKVAAFMELAKDVCKNFKMNSDQTSVLMSSAQKAVDYSSPFTLVHGAFGAGKSFMIAVIIYFYHEAHNHGYLINPNFKILVSSNTNVAVDRVLQGLLKLRFNDFVRVGCIRKIAKCVLPFTAQQMKSSNDDLKELNALLKESLLSPSERRDVQEAIKKFTSNENKAIVSKAFVVGATCLSSSFETMSEFRASLVILDECSQMTEPMSMLVLARFQTERALLVGDPLQLPPTLPGTSVKDVNGLERTLFERLSTSKYSKPILLRTQYRCHPRIAEMSNVLFYKKELKHGLTEHQLSPLLTGIPTLSFIQSGGSETQVNISFVNKPEATSIVELVNVLLSKEVDPSEIGVIALYKGQADLISQLIQESGKSKGIQVSTVDAFQGAEKTVIVMSTVRTHQIGFIDDTRRVNVALTRAKRHLFIFGKRDLLSYNKVWGTVIKSCDKDVYKHSEILRKVANSSLAELDVKPNSSPDTPLTINPNTVNDIEECVTIDFEEERQKPAPVQESRKPTPISTEIHHEQTGLAIEMSQASEELSPINVPFVQNVENTDTLSPDETGPSFKSPELPPSAPVNNHIPIKDPMNDDADKTFLNPADEYDDDITVSDHAPGTTLAAINKNYHHISLHNASITQPTDVLDLIEFDPF